MYRRNVSVVEQQLHYLFSNSKYDWINTEINRDPFNLAHCFVHGFLATNLVLAVYRRIA